MKGCVEHSDPYSFELQTLVWVIRHPSHSTFAPISTGKLNYINFTRNALTGKFSNVQREIKAENSTDQFQKEKAV